MNITVILPIRITRRDAFRLDRLHWISLDPSLKEYASVLVIDDGSDPDSAEKLKARCQELGFGYLYLDTSNKLFSVGRCRNVGSQNATTPYVFFMDVDLAAPPGFFARLDAQIHIQNLDAGAEKFLISPVIYLSRAESEGFEMRYSTAYFDILKDAMLKRDTQRVEKYSPGTSACLYNRHMFLAAGGNDDIFAGWGFEDFDFNCRLLRRSGQFPLPANFGVNHGNFDNQYLFEGFRSVYRLFGDRSAFHGVMLYHVWHPIEAASDYQKMNLANRRLFQQSSAFDGSRPQPPALPDLSCGRTLVVGESNLVHNTKLRPLLGDVVSSQDALPSLSEADLIRVVSELQITQILFEDPYSTEKMASLYDAAKRQKISLLVAGIGALPGSVFFDKNGLLADSSSYTALKWGADLSDADRLETQNYISQWTHEATGHESADTLRQKLSLHGQEYVVLVYLQCPSDPAVTRFAGKAGNYDNFIAAVQMLVDANLPKVRVLIRTHPDVPSGLTGGISVDNHNLGDLISITSAFITFNADAGLLALANKLPVLVWGRAFYGQRELAVQASDVNHMIAFSQSPPEVNFEKVLQFIRYLRQNFYSFVQPVQSAQSISLDQMLKRDFKRLKVGSRRIDFVTSAEIEFNEASPLFDRYRTTKDSLKPVAENCAQNASIHKAETSDVVLRERYVLQIYQVLLWPFLTPMERERLYFSPHKFFTEGKHWTTRLGAWALGVRREY